MTSTDRIFTLMRLPVLLFCLIVTYRPCAAQVTWVLAAELRIGGAFDGPARLSDIGPIAVTSSGNIFFVDANPLQIKLFASSGAFLRNVGQEGTGPGQYTAIAGMVVTTDGNVAVIASAMGRVLVYSPAGDLVRETSAQLSPGVAWEGALTADGSFLDPILVPTGRQLPSGAPEREQRLQRLWRDGTRADTIAFPGCRARNAPADPLLRFPTASGAFMTTTIANIPHAQTVFANDGTAWCAPGDAYVAYHFRVGRPDTLGTLRADVPAPPIPDAERAQLIARYAKAVNFNEASVPKVRPTVASIRLDDQNRVWVRRTDTPIESPQFDVFDAKGVPVATVKTSLKWIKIPLVVGNYAYGVVPDEDGAPYLVRAQIRR